MFASNRWWWDWLCGCLESRAPWWYSCTGLVPSSTWFQCQVHLFLQWFKFVFLILCQSALHTCGFTFFCPLGNWKGWCACLCVLFVQVSKFGRFCAWWVVCRFSCLHREYKYIFINDGLDIDVMHKLFFYPLDQSSRQDFSGYLP